MPQRARWFGKLRPIPSLSKEILSCGTFHLVASRWIVSAGFRQAHAAAQHDLEHAPVVDDHDAGAVAADSLGQVAGDPPGEVDGMSRRDLRPLL